MTMQAGSYKRFEKNMIILVINQLNEQILVL